MRAGIKCRDVFTFPRLWIPACAGMTSQKTRGKYRVAHQSLDDPEFSLLRVDGLIPGFGDDDGLLYLCSAHAEYLAGVLDANRGSDFEREIARIRQKGAALRRGLREDVGHLALLQPDSVTGEVAVVLGQPPPARVAASMVRWMVEPSTPALTLAIAASKPSSVAFHKSSCACVGSPSTPPQPVSPW